MQELLEFLQHKEMITPSLSQMNIFCLASDEHTVVNIPPHAMNGWGVNSQVFPLQPYEGSPSSGVVERH